MTPVDIGYICLGILVVTLFTGIPIAFALPLVGTIGIYWISGPEAAFSMLIRDFYEVWTSYPLTVITMFVLMGSYAFAVGIGSRSYDTCHKVFGHMPGGLAIAAVAAATAFGAVCGSAAATAATIGKVTLPEMRKYAYKDSLSTGIVASAGGLLQRRDVGGRLPMRYVDQRQNRTTAIKRIGKRQRPTACGRLPR